MRITQASVNCIIRVADEYLLMKRSESKDVDPGVVNTLGGKLELDENYAQAAIREAREETGDTKGTYIKDRVEYKGTFIFRGGYAKDWISQFYVINCEHKNIPGEMQHEEGELFWVKANDFSKLDKVIWDLPYCWDVITNDQLTFQMIGILNDDMSLNKLVKTVLDEDGFIASHQVITPQ